MLKDKILPRGDLGKRLNVERSLTSKSHMDRDDSTWLRSWVAGPENSA